MNFTFVGFTINYEKYIFYPFTFLIISGCKKDKSDSKTILSFAMATVDNSFAAPIITMAQNRQSERDRA